MTFGIINKGLGSVKEDEDVSSGTFWGSIVLLFGTILHSLAFVYNEEQLKSFKGLSPLVLCSAMGTIGKSSL